MIQRFPGEIFYGFLKKDKSQIAVYIILFRIEF